MSIASPVITHSEHAATSALAAFSASGILGKPAIIEHGNPETKSSVRHGLALASARPMPSLAGNGQTPMQVAAFKV